MLCFRNGGDDFAGINGSEEARRVLVRALDEAIDGGLELGDGAKDAVPGTLLGELGEISFTSLSQEQDVSVK